MSKVLTTLRAGSLAGIFILLSAIARADEAPTSQPAYTESASTQAAAATVASASRRAVDLTGISLEDLMEIKVTSVSRQSRIPVSWRSMRSPTTASAVDEGRNRSSRRNGSGSGRLMASGGLESHVEANRHASERGDRRLERFSASRGHGEAPCPSTAALWSRVAFV